MKPLGILTSDLLTRPSELTAEVRIPAGYYVNEEVVTREWATGQINPAGVTSFSIGVDVIGFAPRYCALVANSDSVIAANMVMAVFGNSGGARTYYTGSKASLSTTYTIYTNSQKPTCDSNGIKFPVCGSAKYGSFNYRWFALR